MRRRRQQAPFERDHYEQYLEQQCLIIGLPKPVREFRFHPKRKWRFDLAWPESFVAAEIEGGIWAGGRHTTPMGFTADCQKYNAAALLGWRVLRFPPSMLLSGEAFTTIEAALKGSSNGSIKT